LSHNTFLVFLGLMFLVIFGIPAVALTEIPAQCTARWKDSGYAATWSYKAGCRVQLSDKTWVPESAVRTK
jgi:uncharacterized membrane protein